MYLQQEVWGFPPQESVPVNIMAIIEDTGASLVVAYLLDKGFNADGWLGFAFGIGTRHGPMYSHMLGCDGNTAMGSIGLVSEGGCKGIWRWKKASTR